MVQGDENSKMKQTEQGENNSSKSKTKLKENEMNCQMMDHAC